LLRYQWLLAATEVEKFAQKGEASWPIKRLGVSMREFSPSRREGRRNVEVIKVGHTAAGPK